MVKRVRNRGVPGRTLFIVGCGRSGTTLAYDMFCHHRDTAWISTWSDRLLRPEVASLHRASMGLASLPLTRRLPSVAPSEGYRTWDAILPAHAHGASGRLTQDDLTPHDVQQIRQVFDAYRRRGAAPTFVNKNTRNTRRIPFLAASDTDAFFLHVVRHPLDVVSSLLRVAWWPNLPLWIEGGKSVTSLAANTAEQATLAARLWVAETALGLEDGRALGNQYFELRYEDLVKHPVVTLEPVLEAMDMELREDFVSALNAWPVRSSVGSYQSRLSEAEFEAAWPVVAHLATSLGYSADGKSG